MENKSGFFRLDWTDVKKILRGYLVSMLGIIAAIFLSALPQVQTVTMTLIQDSGIFAPVIASLLLCLVPASFEALRRLLTNYKN